VNGTGRGKKKTLWPLTKNSSGQAVLPNLDDKTVLRLQDKKSIVRAFLTSSYRTFSFFIGGICLISTGGFTHNDEAAIPWGQVAAAPGGWIKNWDVKIVLKEPTKMVSSDIDNLYRYLLGRQSPQGDGLEWIQSAKRSKGVARGGQDTGKGKRLEIEDDSDEEEGDDMRSKGVQPGKEWTGEVKKEKENGKGKGKVQSSGRKKTKSKGDRQAKKKVKVEPDEDREASISKVPKAVDDDKMEGTSKKRKSKGDRQAKKKVKVEPDEDREASISEVPKAVDDDKMEGTSKKRGHISSSTGDGPPAKKQRTIAVTTPTTRYGAHPIYLPDC
jgi:hypothetical protein